MALALAATSRESLEAVSTRFEERLTPLAAGDRQKLGEELYAVTRLLVAERGLRRAFSDPATSAEQRAGLAREVLGGKVGAATLDSLADLVGARWSAPVDLVEATESLARTALLAAAEKQRALDDVEDQLFRFGRILEREPQLTGLLADTDTPADKRISLLDGVLGTKVYPVTAALLRDLVRTPRSRHLDIAAEELAELAAGRRRGSRRWRDRRWQGRLRAHGRRVERTAGAAAHLVPHPDLRAGHRAAGGARREPAGRPGHPGRRRGHRRQREREARRRPSGDPELTSEDFSREGTDDPMTELTISPEEIRSAISSYVSSLETGTSREEVGTVSDTGDGIAHVEGLPSAMTNELLEFDGGVRGVALNLDAREIGAVILGDYAGIEEGQSVKRTGEILSVPVGDAFLGRVIDPLGTPIDGLGDIEAETRRILELQAAGVMDRSEVREPLQTGIKAIDAMTPIGRGQRQLIIGDRKTGKTAVCVDTIINQKQNWESGDPTKQVRCIYVAIGQKGSTIAGVRQSLEDAGALEYTTIVAAPASDPAGFKWLAPYTGSSLGQHWMYQGKHVLIVFDDLSKQAEAYRAISLLLRRPPGREAYPGDVFYLHSRLLERCAKLSKELGAGSMTGLPIIETKANDVSAYIPTNVISITDGQVFLESDLFNQGVRPAINVGISVSRVGGSAQIKAMRSVSGSLRLDLSQYRELEAFAAFGSDLDAASAAALGRGERLVELLKQAQYQPFAVEEEVVSIWLGTTGQLDSVPVGDVGRFETDFLAHVRRNHEGVFAEIRDTGLLKDENVERLQKVVDDFKQDFTASDGSSVVKEAKAEALEADEVDQETVKVNKPAPASS